MCRAQEGQSASSMKTYSMNDGQGSAGDGSDVGNPSAKVVSRRGFLQSAAGVAVGSAVLRGIPRTLRPALRSSAQRATKPISVWFPFSLVPPPGKKLNAFAQLLQQFNATYAGQFHINITTNYTAPKLVTAVSGGTAPDLVWLDRERVVEYGALGVISELGQLIKKSSVVDPGKWWPTLLHDVSLRGRIYAVPIYRDMRAFYWNTEEFAAAGLPDKAPSDWSEWLSAIEKTVRHSRSGGFDQVGYSASVSNPPGFLMWYLPFWQLGGEFYNAKQTKVTVNNAAGIQAMAFLKKQFDIQGGYSAVEKFTQGLLPPAGTSRTVFMTGKMAMEVGGSWEPAAMQKYVPSLKYGWGAIPLPHAGAPVANYSGGFTWAIPSNAKNSEGAWRVVEWFMEPQHQLALALGESALPADESVARSAAFLEGEPRKFAAMRKFFVDQAPHAKWVTTRPGVVEMFAVQGLIYDEIMSGKLTPKAGMAEMESQLQAIADQWIARIGIV